MTTTSQSFITRIENTHISTVEESDENQRNYLATIRDICKYEFLSVIDSQGNMVALPKMVLLNSTFTALCIPKDEQPYEYMNKKYAGMWY